ncbi:MAG: type II secretion system GspH family protein [Clostridium sp.]|nr:type II secretion system GspH family protein [Clostridium sp.]
MISKLKINSVNKKKSAFTLIELIVVIAIVAILATALTPSFTGYIKEAKKVAVINQAKNVVTAYESASIKSTSAISKDTSASNFAESSELIDAKDVNKLNNATIQQCYDIINTEENDITLDDDGKFASVKSISSSEDTPE